ncbi:MAG: metallophosphoesterase [Planctomycetaceae bacterium]|nr:MAG: metallophosphoesterase [Planctomycetaceae bacterium]
MPLFVIFFLTLYIGMNSYVFLKIHQAFPNIGRGNYVVAGVLLVLTLLPIMVRLLDRAEYPRLATAMGIVAFSWLAVVFWFCCSSLAMDVWNGGTLLAGKWWPVARGLAIGPRTALCVVSAVIVTFTTWSLIEAHSIGLSEITIQTSRLPAGSKPIRILQISDMHLGGGNTDGRLQKVLAMIDELKPDMVVTTGDMVDSPYDNIKGYADSLAAVKPPLGKFAVMGNHEYYTGLKESMQFFQEAGFRFLRQTSEPAGDNILVAGADDPAGPRNQKNDSPLADPLPDRTSAGEFVLLLKHRPEVQEKSLGRFDLQLSGHTHGGQIFPFNLVIKMIYKYDRGFFELSDGSRLYVSRGTGTWGPPMRLASPPEVTLITLKPAGTK